jgi:molecular chaperone DnaK (HSP70)
MTIILSNCCHRVQEFFPGQSLSRNTNPDEAVAYGAAIAAACLVGHEDFEEMILINVNPLSLGTDRADGSMSVLIPRNSSIPKSITKTYRTSKDNQPTIHFSVYEGEDNHELGEFSLKIEPLPVWKVTVDGMFAMDENRILKVSTVDHIHRVQRKKSR